MLKPFKHALPCARRAFLLKRRIDRSLIQSLDSLLTLCHEEGWYPKVPEPIHYDSASPLSPFLYTLYGKLLQACEEENTKDALNLIQNLYKIMPQGHKRILNYKDKSITKMLWDETQWIALREIPEGGYLAPCPKPLWEEGNRLMTQALDILSRGAKDFFDEHTHLVSQIILVDSERFIGGSSFDMQGCIILKIEADMTLEHIIDLIIHETAHQYVFLLSTLDPLCLNDPHKLYRSPLRKDPRPMMGIFHALFVITRLIHGLRDLCTQASSLSLCPHKLSERIRMYEDKFHTALPFFFEHAHLSALGRDLMRSCESTLK
jgi:hypothetical protein